MWLVFLFSTEPQKALDDAIEMASAVGKSAAKKQKVDQAAADIRAAALATDYPQHKKGRLPHHIQVLPCLQDD